MRTLLTGLFLLLLVFKAQASPDRILVFAASSLRDVMLEIGEAYEERCDCKLVFSFAASSILARQLDRGAPADIFISANENWATWLVKRGVLSQENTSIVASNRLVLTTRRPFDRPLEALLQNRFAMADPEGVPAGVYARQALEKINLWEANKQNAVFMDNVRVTLASVLRGDLLSGIVYQSDLTIAPELHTQYLFDEALHDPIRYVAASLSEDGKTNQFQAFLKSEISEALFEKFGFLAVSDRSGQ